MPRFLHEWHCAFPRTIETRNSNNAVGVCEMIPKLRHSRSQLISHINEYDDGAMTFFATVAVYLIARYVRTERKRDLFAAGIALGLTVLSKETGILLFGSVYAFFALSPEVRFRFREMVPAALIAGGLILVYPLTVAFAGAGTTSTAQQYVIWQFFRFPNHTWDFYLRTLPYEIGPLILLLALVGMVLLWRERSWRERLLVSWIIIPIIFFQFWPTKGFQYLLPTAPIFAVLAGRTLGRWFFSRTGTSDTPRRQLPDYIASIAIIGDAA